MCLCLLDSATLPDTVLVSGHLLGLDWLASSIGKEIKVYTKYKVGNSISILWILCCSQAAYPNLFCCSPGSFLSPGWLPIKLEQQYNPLA